MRSPEEQDLRIKELERKLGELSASMVEQEHRAFPILRNFFVERGKWEPGDPRRDAAAKALLWRIFFSPGTAATVGGLVGLLTLVALAAQTYYLSVQTTSAQEATAELRGQFQQARRTELIAVLYETVSNPEFDPAREQSDENPQRLPGATVRTRTEAVLEFIELERSRMRDGDAPENVDLSGALLQGVRLPDADLRQINFTEASLAGLYAPRADLSGSILARATLRGAQLDQANLEGTVAGYSDFSSASLTDALLAGADFYHSNLSDADLTSADMTRALLNMAKLRKAILRRAILRDAKLDSNPRIPPLPKRLQPVGDTLEEELAALSHELDPLVSALDGETYTDLTSADLTG